MALLEKHIYRTACLFGAKGSYCANGSKQRTWQNAVTGGVLSFPAGVDLSLQIAIQKSEDPVEFYDLTEIASLTLEVKRVAKSDSGAPSASDPTWMEQTVTTLDSQTITAEGWENGTEQHATFAFADEETNIEAGEKWAVLSAITTSGGKLHIYYGKIEVEESGTGVTASKILLPPTYYTASQVDQIIENLRTELGI